MLYFYNAGTTTDLTVYQDSAAATPHAQPVVADSSGLFAPVYVPGTDSYKTVLKTSAGVTVQTVDNIPIASSASSSQPLDADLTILAAAGVAVLSGTSYGLELTNNAADATNDIDIAVGVAIDSANSAFMQLTSGLTKRLDAAWVVGTGQGGLDTGAIANTDYYVYLIKRVDTGVVDVLFSASATAPTMPTNYTLKRRIGAFVRSAGAIAGFGITAAATLNLDTLYNDDSNPVVDVVGTTTTTAITLTTKRHFILRATGAWPLTASATLVVNGSTTINYTCTAGDLLLVDGYSSSTVRIWVIGSTQRMTGQYPFPATQNASSDVNTLDDYEEGTWTPDLQFGGAKVGITYTTQTGTYTKIGNMVTLFGGITLSSKGSSTGTAQIFGFPFVPVSYGTCALQSVTLTGLTAGVFGRVTAGAMTVRTNTTTGSANATDANFAATSSLEFSVSYQI